MLQQMRSAAKYVWIVLIIAFVGGYLLLDSSGLLGIQAISSGTAIGKVNGTDITYGAWVNRTNELIQQQEQSGVSIDRDERGFIENQAFEDLVMEIVLRDELERRRIRVTDVEIRDAARHSPPQALMQNPDLQTDGRFDPAKWERFLASPAVRQQGILTQLEQYYRSMLPQAKLQSQLASDVYVSDARLWRLYQDLHDSAAVSYVIFRPEPGADSALRSSVSDADIAAYYQSHREMITLPTRAVVTALVVSRAPTAADSAAMRDRAEAARQRILKGETFEDVAKEVSDDSASAVDGGRLPVSRFVQEFEDAARKLRRGQVSEPVRTQFGWHIIRLDSLKADTIHAHHILVSYKQSDSSATATDRLADSLVSITNDPEDGRLLDSAAARTGLAPIVIDVIEGQRAMGPDGAALPGVSQWATASGARPGEVSELLDSEHAYVVARLDSLTAGGEAPLARVREDIRLFLARKKSIEQKKTDAHDFAVAALASSFETAATARNLTVETAGPFNRVQFVPGLGQASAPVGAAFALAVGAISDAIVGEDAVYVLRVDRRVNADRAQWTAQIETQRAQLMQRLEQDRWRQYFAALRAEADVSDRRKEIFAASRRQAVAQ